MRIADNIWCAARSRSRAPKRLPRWRNRSPDPDVEQVVAGVEQLLDPSDDRVHLCGLDDWSNREFDVVGADADDAGRTGRSDERWTWVSDV